MGNVALECCGARRDGNCDGWPRTFWRGSVGRTDSRIARAALDMSTDMQIDMATDMQIDMATHMQNDMATDMQIDMARKKVLTSERGPPNANV